MIVRVRSERHRHGCKPSVAVGVGIGGVYSVHRLSPESTGVTVATAVRRASTPRPRPTTYILDFHPAPETTRVKRVARHNEVPEKADRRTTVTGRVASGNWEVVLSRKQFDGLVDHLTAEVSGVNAAACCRHFYLISRRIRLPSITAGALPLAIDEPTKCFTPQPATAIAIVAPRIKPGRRTFGCRFIKSHVPFVLSTASASLGVGIGEERG
jgi:hypothetical protein